MPISKQALPYHQDSALLFECIKHLNWPMFLDSGQAIHPVTQKPGSQYGRYDILVADPAISFVTVGPITKITENGKHAESSDDPFELIKNSLMLTPSGKDELPFTGGALGYFGYDLARRIENLHSLAIDDIEMPELMVGIYDWAVIVDHRTQRTWLVSNRFYTSDQQWNSLCDLFKKISSEECHADFYMESTLESNIDREQYEIFFNKVKRYISEGDCYQVNLAQRFSAKVQGDSWQCYKKLREVSPAPFMAYMDLNITENQRLQVLSASPERFLQLVDGMVETRPIKGTRPRDKDPNQDLNNAIELVTSFKDRAENVMIVDLLRNDIGKVCEIGSVKAEKLFNLQSFANVHHLVSFVTGKLNTQQTAIDLLRSCFPGGSITGAPKLRAMQIIEELEPNRRGLYCGAIGYIGFDGDMDTNIAIRTAVISKERVYFYAGGGIVADSILEKEYKETFDKASNFMTIMQYFMRN